MFYQTEQQEIAGNGRVSSGKKSKDITLSVLVCFCTCVWQGFFDGSMG